MLQRVEKMKISYSSLFTILIVFYVIFSYVSCSASDKPFDENKTRVPFVFADPEYAGFLKMLSDDEKKVFLTETLPIHGSLLGMLSDKDKYEFVTKTLPTYKDLLQILSDEDKKSFVIEILPTLDIVTASLLQTLDIENAQKFFTNIQPALKSVYNPQTKSFTAGDDALLKGTWKLYAPAKKYLGDQNDKTRGLQIEVVKQARFIQNLRRENQELRTQQTRQVLVPIQPVQERPVQVVLQPVPQEVEEDEGFCWGCFCCCCTGSHADERKLLLNHEEK